MAEHKCVIGLFHCGCSRLVTVDELKENIADRITQNAYMRYLGIKSEGMYNKIWSLKEYADKRRSTNLTHFDFCPECGKRVDWVAIRKEDTDG